MSTMEKIVKKKTLLEQHGYNLSETTVILQLKRGFLYFILDIIHVFDLPSLSSSNAGYIQNSKSTARQVASCNYPILNTLQKYYTCYGELCFSEEQVCKETQPIRLDEILNRDQKNNSATKHPFQEICGDLNMLGFTIEAKNESTMPGYEYSMNDSDSMMPIFYVYGLKSNENLTSIEMEIKRKPNLANVVDVCDFESFRVNLEKKNKSLDEINMAFIQSHIILHHRTEFSGDVSKVMFQVLTNLVCNKRVSSKLKPKLDTSWRDVNVSDILDKERFRSFFY